MNSLFLRQEIDEMNSQQLKVEHQLQDLVRTLDRVYKGIEMTSTLGKQNLDKADEQKSGLNALSVKANTAVSDIKQIIKEEAKKTQDFERAMSNDTRQNIRKESADILNRIKEVSVEINKLDSMAVNNFSDLKKNINDRNSDIISTIYQSKNELMKQMNARIDQIEAYNKKAKILGWCRFIVELGMLGTIIGKLFGGL